MKNLSFLKKNINFVVSSLIKILARFVLGKEFIKCINKKVLDPEFVTINFLDSKINLGDLLFFVPFIIELEKRCSKILLVCNELQLNILKCFVPLKNLNNILVNYSNNNKYFDNTVVLYHFNGFNIKNYLKGACYVDPVMVDDLDLPIGEFIAKKIINFLFKKKYSSCYNPILYKPFLPKLKFYDPQKKYTLISDEIYSGLHRLEKRHYNQFKQIILQHKSQNRTIIRISSIKKSFFSELSDIWIRPQKDITILMKVLTIPDIKVISFDNFIAHFSCINNISTVIIFRNFKPYYLNKVKTHFFPCFGNNLNLDNVEKY